MHHTRLGLVSEVLEKIGKLAYRIDPKRVIVFIEPVNFKTAMRKASLGFYQRKIKVGKIKFSRMAFLNKLRFTFLFALCLLFIHSPRGLAEETFRDRDVVRVETRAARATENIAEQAKVREALEGDIVTYEQVLKDPDNLELNFKYAKQQVRKNDLLGAAATLERILMINPNLPKVRLFYAIVLFRLDNLSEARRELELLENVQMPDSLRREVNLYVKQIKARGRRTRLTVRQSTGIQYDTNRNASPSSQERFFANFRLPVTGTAIGEKDSSLLLITSADVVHDLGFQAGHEIFGTFTHFVQEQTEVDSLDLMSFQYELGGTYKSKWVNLTPSFHVSHVFLSRQSFLQVQGGRVRADRVFFRRWQPFAEVRVERQNFLDISENITSEQRNGNEVGLTFGHSFTLTPTMRLTNSLIYTNKNAKEDFNAYERLGLEFGHTWLLGKGQFLLNFFGMTIDGYDQPDLAIVSRLRRDKTFRYRATYGAPLTTLLIGKILPAPLKDITLTVTYEYFRSLSNITNFTYKNSKFQGMLTKRIEF